MAQVVPGSNPSAAFFKLNGGISKLLAAAFERYASLTFPHPVDSTSARNLGLTTTISALSVTVASLAEDFPQLGDNESYTLSVSATGTATLTAPTVRPFANRPLLVMSRRF